MPSKLDVLPLGSGAIAGTGFPVDRARQAALLGFAQVSENSVDATGDRDFAMEAVAAASGLLVHLSRWAEELVLWTTKEFEFASLPDSIMTGSSLMPQKKNPDLLELVRAQAGVALGSLVTLATVMKGIPLGVQPRSSRRQGAHVRRVSGRDVRARSDESRRRDHRDPV